MVHEGRIASLRRVKDDVKEVAAGLECGMGVEGFTGWKEGDTVQVGGAPPLLGSTATLYAPCRGVPAAEKVV